MSPAPSFWNGHGDPSAPAVYDVTQARWWSYRELDQLAGDFAALLPRHKQLVFLRCRNDLATVAGYLGAVSAGHAVALLDDRMDAGLFDRLEQLYAPECVLGPPAPGSTTPNLREGKGDARGPIDPAVALLLSTSGTTGSPKFARLTPGNLSSNARSIATALEISPADRAITSLPLHYSYGLSVLNSHLHAGASVVLTDGSMMEDPFWGAFRSQRCTSLAGVPYSYQLLKRLDLDQLDIPSLSVMTQAGGKLHDQLVLQFHERMAARNGKFYVMYGQTEATARISVLPATLLPAKVGSVGRAIPDGTLTIEADGTDTGELVYRGPNVMLGYAHNRAELAGGDELGGVLRTGDLGRLDADGLLYISGRSTRIAKVFGLRVNLEEVESVVRQYGPAATIGGEDRLIIFCEQGDAAAHDGWATELARLFRVNRKAFDFRRVDRLPLMASGKIDYRALHEAV